MMLRFTLSIWSLSALLFGSRIGSPFGPQALLEGMQDAFLSFRGSSCLVAQMCCYDSDKLGCLRPVNVAQICQTSEVRTLSPAFRLLMGTWPVPSTITAAL